MARNTRYFFGAALVLTALAEVLCEDLAVLCGAPAAVRRVFACAGFCFDVFFTAWFLVGLYTASLNRKARRYFIREGGWMDFLASVPLLVLHSGPALFGIAAGGLYILPHIARMTAGLRFLRFLKLFRLGFSRLEGRGGPAFLVSVLIVAGSLLGPAISLPGILEKRVLDDYAMAAGKLALDAGDTEKLTRAAYDYSRVESGLLLVKKDSSPVYSRYDGGYYAKYFAPADYLWRKEMAMDFYFSRKPLLAEDARRGVSYFCVLAALFPALFLYARLKVSREGAENRGTP